MPTTVVNVKTAKRGTYIFCARPTIYGNPFRIGRDGTRLDVIVKYIDYFFDRLERDVVFKEKVLGLKNKTIGCYCHPDLCHLHVIAYYLDYYV